MANCRIKKLLIVLLNIVLYLIYGKNIGFILVASVGTYFFGKIAEKNKNTFFKIHNLYMTCGDADNLVYSSFPSYVKALKNWDRVENFKSYVYQGGTHDFPVWFKGFHDFIQMVFK